jgi:glycosyltransferase involved in cell wall biosynthesis
MNILFLLSCLEPAGSETYCVTLAKAWEGRHRIFWISDRLHFGQTYTSWPISRKAIPGGVINTVHVVQYIKANRIDVVHSHSRRAHWVGAQAARLAGIPHVTTIHQPPPVHFFSNVFPCLGDATIAIDETVYDHLLRHFKRGLRKLKLIRNGIDLDVSLSGRPSAENSDRRVIYLGRLTGGRWRGVLFIVDVLKRIGKSLPTFCFQIAGRLPVERTVEMERLLKDLNTAIHPSFAERHDFIPDLPRFLSGATGVIAAGRSALESMAAERPVIALGETGVVGLCADETWEEAKRTNFGDHFESGHAFYPAKLEVALRQLLDPSFNRQALGRWGRIHVDRDYNIQTLAPQIEDLYRTLLY